MSTVKVSYCLTSVARKVEGVRTGNVPAGTQVVEIELGTLSAEQREAVLAAPGTWTNLEAVELSDPVAGTTHLFVDSVLDADAVVTLCAKLCAQMQAKRAEWDANRHESLTKIVANKTAQLEKLLAEHNTNVNDYYYLIGDEKRDCERLGIFRAGLDAVWKEFKDRQPEFRAEAAKRKAANEAEEELHKAEAKKAEEVERQERLAWAKEHGSDRLRRILEGGYEAGRLYWIERCAVDYPICVLDYDKNAEDKERIAPKTSELDALDALKAAHPDAEIKIVWLTAEPLANKRDEDADWDSDFEPCAALVIDDPAYKRFIYKLL